MRTLKEVVQDYGQEEVARQSGRSQSGICSACRRDVYAHEVDGHIVLFEVRRIDKTGLDVASPRLSLPKKVTK